jgi:hypothetical protein
VPRYQSGWIIWETKGIWTVASAFIFCKSIFFCSIVCSYIIDCFVQLKHSVHTRVNLATGTYPMGTGNPYPHPPSQNLTRRDTRESRRVRNSFHSRTWRIILTRRVTHTRDYTRHSLRNMRFNYPFLAKKNQQTIHDKLIAACCNVQATKQ